MKRILVTQVIPGVVMLLFLYTALSKLLDHARFESVIQQSPTIGKSAGLLSWGIPAAELVVAGLIFHPATRLPGMLFSFFLLLLFTGYLFTMLASGMKLPCSCGGVVSTMTWKEHVLFNLIFIMLSAVSVILLPRYLRPESVQRQR